MSQKSIVVKHPHLKEDLQVLLRILVENISPYLERIRITFPQYTDHGPNHSHRIVDILHDVILDDENIEYLYQHQWTYFFLLASAYVHDIGMVDFPDLQTDEGDPLSANDIRATHNLRSTCIIKSKWKDFGLRDEFQARIIAEISERHTGPISPEDLVATSAYATEAVNVGFCRACLRLADELDLPKERADRRLAEFITDSRSTLEWVTHYSISGVIKHPQLKQVILVDSYCGSKEAHRKLKSLETKINKLLGLITTHVDPRLQYTQCTFQIESEGYVDKDLKFTIDENSMWPMIVGDILYQDNRVFIRELLQNALDACLFRKYREPSYQPDIHIYYDNKVIKVIDNGTGMDLGIIEKYLVRICVSFYESEHFLRDKPERYYPISRFGIGILSCFMVADRVQVKTSIGNGKCYHLSINDIRDYVHVEQTADKFQGTVVEVSLKTSISNVILFLRDTFRYTDLGIVYHYPKGDTEWIGRRPFTKRELVAFGYRDYSLADEYPIEFNSSSGFLWYFPVSDSRGKHPDNGDFLVLMNGIKVGTFPLLPAWCRLQVLRGVVNLRDEERLDLTASRNDIVRNHKYASVVSRVEATLIQLLRSKIGPVADQPSEVRKILTDSVNPDRATGMLSSLIRVYFYFEMYHLRRTDKGYQRTGRTSILKYDQLEEKLRNATREEILNRFDHFDIRMLVIGKKI